MSKKKEVTKYEKTFDGNQRITWVGKAVIMSDGTRFKNGASVSYASAGYPYRKGEAPRRARRRHLNPVLEWL